MKSILGCIGQARGSRDWGQPVLSSSAFSPELFTSGRMALSVSRHHRRGSITDFYTDNGIGQD